MIADNQGPSPIGVLPFFVVVGLILLGIVLLA